MPSDVQDKLGLPACPRPTSSYGAPSNMGPQAPPSNGHPWVSIDENGDKWHWYGGDRDYKYEWTRVYKKGNLMCREQIRIWREHQQEAFMEAVTSTATVNTGSDAVATSAASGGTDGMTAVAVPVPNGQPDLTDLHNWLQSADYGVPNIFNTPYGTNPDGTTNYFHHGIDRYLPDSETGNNISLGASFRSPYAGTVRRVGYDTSMGNFIEINMGDGWICSIQHLNTLPPLNENAVVTTQTVFVAGNTGGPPGMGAHVHISVYKRTTFEGAMPVIFGNWTGYYMRPPTF